MINSDTIVYTSGTFDMFHSNHVKMIEYARGLGEILIVGVSTDELVCSYKNPPIVPFEERIEIIRSLKYPNIVIPQHTLDHSETVKNLHIDVFVVGDDWKGKYDYLEELGIKVFYFPYGKGSSSTVIKDKIYKQYERIKSSSEIHTHPEIKKP
jgi:glycerol-3-phosphate cytidylyltransferase